MKKLLCLVIACTAIGLVGAGVHHAGRGAGGGQLSTLKFESIPPQPRVVEPPKFKVTKATIEHLEKLMKEGKTIEVQGNGALKILEPSKPR